MLSQYLRDPKTNKRVGFMLAQKNETIIGFDLAVSMCHPSDMKNFDKIKAMNEAVLNRPISEIPRKYREQVYKFRIRCAHFFQMVEFNPNGYKRKDLQAKNPHLHA